MAQFPSPPTTPFKRLGHCFSATALCYAQAGAVGFAVCKQPDRVQVSGCVPACRSKPPADTHPLTCPLCVGEAATSPRPPIIIITLEIVLHYHGNCITLPGNLYYISSLAVLRAVCGRGLPAPPAPPPGVFHGFMANALAHARVAGAPLTPLLSCAVAPDAFGLAIAHPNKKKPRVGLFSRVSVSSCPVIQPDS